MEKRSSILMKFAKVLTSLTVLVATIAGSILMNIALWLWSLGAKKK
jgi:hypothetical protein